MLNRFEYAESIRRSLDFDFWLEVAESVDKVCFVMEMIC